MITSPKNNVRGVRSDLFHAWIALALKRTPRMYAPKKVAHAKTYTKEVM